MTPTLALVLALVSATPADHAPLGLRWGMAPAEVRKALEARLSFVSADKGLQRYRGEVAGLPTDEVQAVFDAEGLGAVLVRFHNPDQVPASRRYAQTLEKMIAAHGQPTAIAAPPGPGSYAQNDEALRQQRWTARATWDLGQSMIVVSVVVDPPDRAGRVHLSPVFGFMGPRMRELALEKPASDL